MHHCHPHSTRTGPGWYTVWWVVHVMSPMPRWGGGGGAVGRGQERGTPPQWELSLGTTVYG